MDATTLEQTTQGKNVDVEIEFNLKAAYLIRQTIELLNVNVTDVSLSICNRLQIDESIYTERASSQRIFKTRESVLTRHDNVSVLLDRHSLLKKWDFDIKYHLSSLPGM